MVINKTDNKFKSLLIVVIVIAAGLFLVNILRQDSETNISPTPTPEPKAELSIECESAGGTWLADYSECEWVSEETCIELGGSFNECDSACRHESGLVACTMNCVAVCGF